MCCCIIVGKKPVTTWPITWLFSPNCNLLRTSTLYTLLIVWRRRTTTPSYYKKTMNINLRLLPLWILLFCCKVITINPRFINGNNLFRHISIVSDHFEVVLDEFKVIIFLVCLEKFWNEYGFSLLHTHSIDDLLQQQVAHDWYYRVLLWSKFGQNGDQYRSFLNRLYHTLICVLPTYSPPKAFCIISPVSAKAFPVWSKTRWKVVDLKNSENAKNTR